MSVKNRKARVYSLKPGVIRKGWYKVIPYNAVAGELVKGREVLIEGISRQLARFAAEKLSRMIGAKVEYCRGDFDSKDGLVVSGYAFFVSGNARRNSGKDARNFSSR
jgi:hypothetical protein